MLDAVSMHEMDDMHILPHSHVGDVLHLRLALQDRERADAPLRVHARDPAAAARAGRGTSLRGHPRVPRAHGHPERQQPPPEAPARRGQSPAPAGAHASPGTERPGPDRPRFGFEASGSRRGGWGKRQNIYKKLIMKRINPGGEGEAGGAAGLETHPGQRGGAGGGGGGEEEKRSRWSSRSPSQTTSQSVCVPRRTCLSPRLCLSKCVCV